MKIVIYISEEQYEIIKELVKNQNRVCPEADSAEKIILSGTPLPKGHGRLIDKNELIKRYVKDCGRRIYVDNFIFDLENNTPTIIEADRESEEEE